MCILSGQSNMLGADKINPKKGKPEGCLTYAVKEKQKYPCLVDDSGEWAERKDVRNVGVMGVGGARCSRKIKFLSVNPSAMR